MNDDIVVLLRRLESVGNQLLKWTVLRLERRHCSSEGNLLDVSKRLATKLDEIPGPGFDLPRQLDDTNLPSLNDFNAIKNEVKKLENATFLPLAGSKEPVKVIS